VRGNTFAAADEAQALVGGRLDGNAVDMNPADFSDPPPDRVAMRRDLWRFGDQRKIEVGNDPAAGGNAAHRFGEKTV
jgi:hypothetical protein